MLPEDKAQKTAGANAEQSVLVQRDATVFFSVSLPTHWKYIN